MATSKPGDDVAMWSGWRMFLFGAILVMGSVVGSLGASMALYGFRYNLLLGALIFETGFAVAYTFCGGRIGRGYYPLHPIVIAQMPRLLALHIATSMLLVLGGVLLIEYAPVMSTWWTFESGPQRSPLRLICSVSLATVMLAEVSLARRWLYKAVNEP